MKKRISKEKDSLNKILKRSSKAICGIMEREIVVKNSQVNSVIKKLKSSGYRIIGISYGKSRAKRIWFIRSGGF